MVLTKHSKQRMKERQNLGKSSENLARKALTNGLDRHDFKDGRMKDYITWLYHKNKSANNIRFYGEYVYIFSDDILITTFRIPKEHLKSVLKKKKSQEKESA